MQQLYYDNTNDLSFILLLVFVRTYPKVSLNSMILQWLITLSQCPYYASCILTQR